VNRQRHRWKDKVEDIDRDTVARKRSQTGQVRRKTKATDWQSRKHQLLQMDIDDLRDYIDDTDY